MRKGGSSILTTSYFCGGYVSKGKSTCRMGNVGTARIEPKVLDALRDEYFADDGEAAIAATIPEELSLEVKDRLAALPAAARARARVKIEEASAIAEGGRRGREGARGGPRGRDRRGGPRGGRARRPGRPGRVPGDPRRDDGQAKKDLVRTFVHRVTID